FIAFSVRKKRKPSLRSSTPRREEKIPVSCKQSVQTSYSSSWRVIPATLWKALMERKASVLKWKNSSAEGFSLIRYILQVVAPTKASFLFSVVFRLRESAVS